MKVTVLNGSPKGEISVTLQSLRFVEKKIPHLTLCEHHVSQRIRRIAKEKERFDRIMTDVADADAVIWSVPLYVLTVPSQFHRFIELISEHQAEDVFKGKYAAVITTSIHFFDHTAHDYMRAVCEDLGMIYLDGFSPDMMDLLKEDQQAQLMNFAGHLIEAVTEKQCGTRLFQPLHHDPVTYIPGPSGPALDAKDKQILVLADGRENPNLNAMIDRFVSGFSSSVQVCFIADIHIKGGCIGCVKCGPDYECSYQGQDGYIDFYNETLKTADAIIFAGTTKGRYLSWQMKQFIDRSFFNTHTPTLASKQLGFLIAGPLRQLANLKQILQAYTEWQHANIIGMVSDEYESCEQIDRQIDNLAKKTASYLSSAYIRPSTFLGVGGMKIFRDDIYGRLRFVFQADHKYYEQNGAYDFPQNEKEVVEFSESMVKAMEDPDVRQKMRSLFRTQMVKPHQTIVENA